MVRTEPKVQTDVPQGVVEREEPAAMVALVGLAGRAGTSRSSFPTIYLYLLGWSRPTAVLAPEARVDLQGTVVLVARAVRESPEHKGVLMERRELTELMEPLE